jgi:methionine-rich copper-binding protein CopC
VGSVAASGSCTIYVTFSPTAINLLTGTLTITDNGGGVAGSTQTVALSGTGINPGAGLSAASEAFGSQVINTTSSTRTVTLTSTGTTSLSIASITITGTNTPDFHETNPCPATLAPAAKCTISLTYTPTILGAETASLSVTDNASNSPQMVALTGTGAAPAFLSSTSLAFGSVGENSPSAKTITLYNNEAVALTISSITTGNPDFTESNTCGTSLAAKGHCTITVTLTPSILGAETGTLTVNDATSNSPQIAALTGTGVVPAFLSSTSLAFGSVGENSPSAAKTTTLYNNEAVALTISSITTGNPDFTESNTCGTSLAAKGHCTITVTLTPSVLTAETGTLTVNDAASNSPQTATLTGTGIVPATVSPTSLTFTARTVGTTSAAMTVTLTSNLALAMPISSLTFTGANALDFAAPTNTCGASLAAKAHCTISITFTPGATGTRTATLNVSDSASNTPQTVALTGTGE